MVTACVCNSVLPHSFCGLAATSMQVTISFKLHQLLYSLIYSPLHDRRWRRAQTCPHSKAHPKSWIDCLKMLPFSTSLVNSQFSSSNTRSSTTLTVPSLVAAMNIAANEAESGYYWRPVKLCIYRHGNLQVSNTSHAPPCTCLVKEGQGNEPIILAEFGLHLVHMPHSLM